MKKQKKIYILDGHPYKDSLTGSFALAYKKCAERMGCEVKLSHVGEMKFDPVLHKGYKERQELELDLLKWQEDVKWADHIVLLFPVWWGGLPALLKGLFDRALLSGFGFRYRKTGLMWDKLLSGKTGRIITTADAPKWYTYLTGNRPGKQTARNIFAFCGIKTKVTEVAPVKSMSENQIKNWMKKIEKMGELCK